MKFYYWTLLLLIEIIYCRLIDGARQYSKMSPSKSKVGKLRHSATVGASVLRFGHKPKADLSLITDGLSSSVLHVPEPVVRFAFSQDTYVATIPENSRGKVFAVPKGKMGVTIPRNDGQVKFKIVKGDPNNFFKAEAEKIGNFVFLRLRTRPGLDVSLNREHTDRYDLLIKATYKHTTGRNIETRATVQVKITDVNDLAPLFHPDTYDVTVPEDLPVFSSIVTVSASDSDIGINGEIYYYFQQPSDVFAIHPSRGVITLLKPFFKSASSILEAADHVYRMTVVAEDRRSVLLRLKPGILSGILANETTTGATTVPSTAQLTITVNKVNVHPPKIDVVQFAEIINSLDQQQPSSQRGFSIVVAGLRVTDPDLDRHGEIKQVFVASSDYSGLFQVIPVRGGNHKSQYHLMANYRLLSMHSNIPSVNISLVAIDNGIPPLNSTKSLSINLADNPSTMKFNASSYIFHVNETSLPSTPVAFVTLPAAPFGRFTYELVSGGPNNTFPFAVNSISGLLYVSEPLDYETKKNYSFKIKAINSQTKIFTDETSIEIELRDENDNSPEFALSSAADIFISTETAVESVIGSVQATDRDSTENGQVTYSLSNADSATPFLVDAYTGEIKLLKRATQKNYTLMIRAHDSGIPRRESELSVHVVLSSSQAEEKVTLIRDSTRQNLLTTIVNEYSPMFSASLPKEIEVAENSPVGVPFGVSFSATDDDYGPNGWLRYVISKGGASDNDGLLSVDSVTGELVLLGRLNRNRRSSHDIVVSAVDMGQPRRSTERSVRIQIKDSNDNAPVFDKPSYSVHVREDTAVGTEIVKVHATDLDEGLNAEVCYSLAFSPAGFYQLLQHSTDDSSAFFTINSNGVISAVRPLDREMNPVHVIWVKAEDKGFPPLHSLASVTVTLDDVNDNPPFCDPKIQRIQLAEDIPIGCFVTCIFAKDFDMGISGQFTFAFEHEKDLPFALDQDTGCIFMNGVNGQGLDFDTKQLYNISLEVTDRGFPQFSSLCYLEVEVIDVNENFLPPLFSDFAYTAEVFENEDIGTQVFKVKAVDPDAPSTVSSESVLYYIGDGDGLGLFSIDADGIIRTVSRLDRETKDHYWLTVFARDQATVPLSSSTEVYIQVKDKNDNFPVAHRPIIFATVPENSSPGILVAHVEAYDPDDNGRLSFKITRGDPQSFFRIDPYTGYITTHGRKLDREKQEQHELDVTISDSGDESLTSTAIVVVDVTDVNDSPPKFKQEQYTFNVPRITSGYEHLCRVFAVDDDIGENARLVYEIIDANTNVDQFRINQTTGYVYATSSLHGDYFELKVKATDSGTPRLSSVTRVMLTVVSAVETNNVTSNSPPVLIGENEQPVSFNIGDILPGSKIGSLYETIEIQDQPDQDLLWFEMLDESIQDFIHIRKDNGEVQLVRKLQESDPQQFELPFSVSDGYNVVKGSVTVYAKRQRFVRPRFDNDTYEVSIEEDAKIGSVILRPKASVGSELSYSAVVYSLFGSVNTDSLKKFKVESSSGNVILVDNLDHETQRQHTIFVMALFGNQRTLARVVVKILDVNEHSPQFSSSYFETKVFETAAIGTVVTEVLAYDRDHGDNAKITYTIISGNSQRYFDIDPALGLITVARQLDVRIQEFVLEVKAADGGVPAKAATVSVRILVVVSPISAPKFRKDVYAIDVAEDIAVGSLIVSVVAEATCGFLYRLKNSTKDTHYFRIAPNSGMLFLNEPLNFDHKRYLTVDVMALTASGVHSTTSVEIRVLDSNTHRPMFNESIYHGSVSENMPVGTVVSAADYSGLKSSKSLIVTATDLDTGTNAIVSYRIVDPWAAEFFAVDYSTGAIRTRAMLDYEKQKAFSFEVTASDLGSPSLNALVPTLVTISVVDVDDVAPVFDRSDYHAALYLPVNAGVRLVQVSASDEDESSVVRYCLAPHQIDASVLQRFEIGEESGVLRVRSQLPSEEWKQRYEIHILASDGLHQVKAKVNVEVKAAPKRMDLKFSKDEYHVAVLENQTDSAGSMLLMLHTIGNRIGEFVEFSLLNDENPWFKLDPVSGVLETTNVPLDREETPNHVLVVEARVGRNHPRTVRSTVIVQVLDVNDERPTFVDEPYHATVVFDALTNFTSVTALDRDLGPSGETEYSIKESSQFSKHFGIDPVTGMIQLLYALPSYMEGQEHTLTVVAADKGIPSLSSTAEVALKIVNRLTPNFAQSFYRTKVFEAAALGTSILTTAAFSSVNGQLIYYLVQGNGTLPFEIEPITGVITVKRSLDYEDSSSYQLIVQCFDVKNNVSSEVSATIEVLDENDNRPLFPSSLISVSVSEGTPILATVHKLVARDLDTGDNAKLSYSIREIANDEESTDALKHFTIDAESGQLQLIASLDYETRKVYRFEVVVKDAGLPSLSSSATVLISVNDENDCAPVFSSTSKTLYISSRIKSGDFVDQISAVDPDTISRGRMIYSILDGNDDKVFNIDQKTGVLTVLKPVPETAKEIMLNVSVSDGMFTTFQHVLLNIELASSENPVFEQRVYEATVKENTPIRELLTVKATGGIPPLHYSFIADTFAAAFLRIDQHTGQMFTRDRLKYSSIAKYKIPLIVRDKQNRIAVSELLLNVLNVNDESPHFLSKDYRISVEASTAVDSVIIQLKAVDEDLDELEYSIDNGTGQAFEVLRYFSMDRNGNLSIRQPLYNVAGSIFHFFAEAVDNFNPPHRASAAVEVTIVPPGTCVPTFASSEFTFHVSEATRIDKHIGTLSHQLSTACADIPRRYSISKSDLTTDASNVLHIDSTGKISLAEELDREQVSTYSSHVTASMTLPTGVISFSTALVHLVVDDVNDFVPEFLQSSFNVAVLENAPTGTSAMWFDCRDLDSGSAGSVRFGIQRNSYEQPLPFEVDAETGWLIVSGPLDREQKDSYNFNVTCSDNGVPSLRSLASVTVSISDVNDSPPRFAQKQYSFEVSENAKLGHVIGEVLAIDDDINSYITYHIVGGNSKGHFVVNRLGQLSVAQMLDYELEKACTLTVIAYDGIFSNVVHVHVYILNVEDTAPFCEKTQVFVHIAENASIGTELANVINAQQRDLSGSALKFEIVNANSPFSEAFGIDEHRGVLFVSKALDREKIPSYGISVRAVASSGFFCETRVKIDLDDVNDFVPEFKPSAAYMAQLLENVADVPRILTVVHAYDLDLGLGGQVAYSLLDSFDNTFSVDALSGVVVVLKPLDREQTEYYNLTVLASDKGHPVLSSLANVVVTILDEVDNPPHFERTTYSVSIKENSGQNSVLMTVHATSKDVGPKAHISYRIISNSPADEVLFRIDSTSGDIVLLKPLDFELQQYYVLAIEAKCGSDPPLLTTAHINVTVLDVNDNAPKYVESRYFKKIREDALVGSKLVQVLAHDLDSAEFGTVDYRITMSSVQSVFNVTKDGWIVLASEVDRETVLNYTVSVEAFDHGIPPLKGTTSVIIELEDVNDCEPVIKNCENLSLVIHEGSHSSFSYQFSVSDQDGPNNGAPFRFRLRGDGAEKFSVTTAGLLQTRGKLLYSEKSAYELTVTVTDSGTPVLSNQCSFTVNVIEESKHAPVLTKIHRVQIRTYLGEFPGGLIARLVANDDDPLDKLTYGIQHTKFTKEHFSVDPTDGSILALAGLPATDVILNVSVTDGKFVSYGNVSVEVQDITEDLLEHSISIQFANTSTNEFLAKHVDRFVRVISRVLSVRPRNVVILSVQTTSSSLRSRRAADTKQLPELDVLFAVEKIHGTYFKPLFVQRRIENNRKDLSADIGPNVVNIFTAMCTQDSCAKGECVERLWLDDVDIESIIAGTSGSFVAPRHYRTTDCVCHEGFGGPQCLLPVNPCSREPCTSNKICIPSEDTVSAYSCVCPAGRTGPTCAESTCSSANAGDCDKNFAMSFSGKSYIRYTLSSPADRRLQLALELKTTKLNGVLMWASGKIDFNVLECVGGVVRYRFDCGSGEGTLSIPDVNIADGQWHLIKVGRLGRHARLTIDDKFTTEGNAPGPNQVLNLDNDNIYFGGMRSLRGGHEEVVSGFVGCMNRIYIDQFELPKSKPSGLVRLYNVKFGCSDPEPVAVGVCAAQPCKNFGVCSAEVPAQSSKFSCLCHPRFVGDRCEVDTNACASAPCWNGASCENKYNDFFCRCPLGWTGRECREQGVFLHCSSSPCRNGATCKDIPGSFTCNCTKGWRGRLCNELEKPVQVEGGLWGVSLTELLIGAAALFGLALLAMLFACCCRRRNQRKFKKKRYHLAGNNINNELNDSYAPPMRQGLVFNNLKSGSGFDAVSSGSGSGPPLFPRRQFQRGNKLSTQLDTALNTRPTVTVRPLSFNAPSASDIELNSGFIGVNENLECAADYGSAAEELENLSRYSQDGFMETFGKAPAKSVVMDADNSFSYSSRIGSISKPQCENVPESGLNSFDRSKTFVKGSSDIRRPRADGTAEHKLLGAESLGSIQCLTEEEVSSADCSGKPKCYHWDYSDWNSTLGHPSKTCGALTLSGGDPLLSDSDDDTGMLPKGVSQLEDTEPENEDCVDYDDAERVANVTVPEASNVQQRLESLQLLNRFGQSKKLKPSPRSEQERPLVSDQTVDDCNIPPMKPFKVDYHLNRYLPKHAPDSCKSDRRLISPAVDILSNSSEESDGNEEGEYELGSGLHYMSKIQKQNNNSATAPAALRHRPSPKSNNRTPPTACVQPYGFTAPKDCSSDAITSGIQQSSLLNLSSFRSPQGTEAMVKSSALSLVEEPTSAAEMSEIEGLCELEDMESEDADSVNVLQAKPFSTANGKQTEV